MLRAKLEASGSITRQILEGLRLDLDILKYAFQRWMFRLDGKLKSWARSSRTVGIPVTRSAPMEIRIVSVQSCGQ